MKRILFMSIVAVSCYSSTAWANIWVHNKSQFPITVIAKGTLGTEAVSVGVGKAAWHSSFKPAFYSSYTIQVTMPDGSKKDVYSMSISEGGNRKLVIKDKGSLESLYIASHDLEIRPPLTWSTTAEDTDARWL